MNSQQFIAARKDHELAVLEGFHALKHALRFGAEIVDLVTPNKETLIQLTKKLAPDILDTMERQVREVSDEEFADLSPIQIKSGVLAVAKRSTYDSAVVMTTKNPVVWLDNPKNHENVGAVIRLSAGIGAGAVVATGDLDIWNPGVLRGSAGLHYAVPVIKTSKPPGEFGKSVFVFDDSGGSFEQISIQQNSVLVFGSERSGVSEQIKAAADAVVGIPMTERVSSLNLATAVAIGLYSVKSRIQ